MRIVEACHAIAQARGDRVLVATMGSMFALDHLGISDHRLSSVPLMGGAASLGLGLALGHPEIGVVVIDGDASLLMQLGVLVTVAENMPQQFIHFVVHNGMQFTGVSNLAVPGADAIDFNAMALAAGYVSAHRVEDVDSLIAALPVLLATSGPAFVTLVVEPEPSAFGASQPQPEIPDRQFQRMAEEAEQLGQFYSKLNQNSRWFAAS